MSGYGLDAFMTETRAAVARLAELADCVEAVAPLLHRLINGSRDFLKPEHFRARPDHYARNAIHIDDDGGPSLYSLVWTPGQWTPVHDHGTWGVVGIVQGVLEERNLIRVSADDGQNAGIDLRRGGPILLGEGTVTTFVPNPDHIHKTGVPEDRAQAVSLHLYGRAMNSFHVYDVEAGTRQRIEVFHNES
jgi:predicted metal-dependent enzyme (double-stranded beta helix superfamily)